jgi:dihydropteroate synthase
MLEEGAAIIDVGGESTRPGGRTYGEGALAVAEAQERQRVLPVVEAIAQRFPDALLSIDSYKPSIAQEAVEAGAHLINDVTGLRLYPEMASVAARLQVPLILMHSLGRPGEMPHEHRYDDVVTDVRRSLASSIEIAHRAGVAQLVTDPGFGFGKTPAENLRLLNHVDRFVDLGYPVLVGISRKSTIGMVLGEPNGPARVDERLFGSLGATAVAILRGVSLVRTHDVRPTVDMLRVLGAAACS